MTFPLFHPRSRRQLPLSLTRDQFATAFPAEGGLVEFKRGSSAVQLQATAVAFSNATGGVLIVGVTDDREIYGYSPTPGAIDAIHEALSSAHDLGRYEIHALDVDGVTVAVISIARREEGFAQTSNGRVLVRRGSRDDAPIGSALQAFINERAVARFESSPAGIGVDAADASLLDRLATAHGWSGGRAVLESLEEIGLAKAGLLTVAGVLWLTTDPASVLGKSFVEVLRYPDDHTTDYDRREEIRGPIDLQLEGTSRAILDHLGTELVVLGLRRFELERVPEVVIREAVANAVAHRSYETRGAPVRVELRPGVVRIVSPGRLPEPVTVANMRETSAARNPDLIRVMRRFDLAEDVGRGVDVMQDTMAAEMLDPPRFADTGHSVVVELPTRSAVAPVERAWIRELETRGVLAPQDRLVLVHAARGEQLTNSTVRELTNSDSRVAREILSRLRDQGFLVQSGQRGGATYGLAQSLRPPAGLRLDAAGIADVVEGLASDGPISNADVRTATGLDRVESLAVLGQLVIQERLIRTGQGRGTRYRRPS